MFGVQQKMYGEKNDKVVVVIGGWRDTQARLWLLGKLLESYHFKAIIFTYDKDILSTNPDITLAHFTFLEKEVVKTIKALPKNHKKISLFGISQGTMVASMVCKKIPKIDKLILNISGSDLAEVIWKWESIMPGFKEKLTESHKTLSELKEVWQPLSPTQNLQKSHVHEILLYLACNDELISYHSQQELLLSLRETDIRIEAIVNERHKHGTSVVINLLHFPIYMKFLLRESVTEPRQKRVS